MLDRILAYLAQNDRFMRQTAYIVIAMARERGRVSTRAVRVTLEAAERDGLVTRSEFPKGNYGYRWTLTDAGRARAAIERANQPGNPDA